MRVREKIGEDLSAWTLLLCGGKSSLSVRGVEPGVWSENEARMTMAGTLEEHSMKREREREREREAQAPMLGGHVSLHQTLSACFDLLLPRTPPVSRFCGRTRLALVRRHLNAIHIARHKARCRDSRTSHRALSL